MALPVQFFTVIFALGTDQLGFAMRVSTQSGSEWHQAPNAAVHAERKEVFKEVNATQAVEFLRFVTAYKKGLETLVDITAYSALLRAAADADQELTFYSFIDTWVGNTSDRPVLYHNGNQCSLTSSPGDFNGNGWLLEADLVFWPKSESTDTRPYESMTIASGHYGAYGMGAISVHEGTVAENGKMLVLDEAADVKGLVEKDVHVYRCPGGAKDVHQAEQRAAAAEKVESLMKKHASKEVDDAVQDIYKDLMQDQLFRVTVTSTDSENQRVEATYDSKRMHMQVDMPVYLDGSDIIETDHGFNMSHPTTTPVGKVVAVHSTPASITIQMDIPCLPSEATLGLPHLRVPSYPEFLEDAKKLSESMRKVHVPDHSQLEHPLMDDSSVSLLAVKGSRSHTKGTLHFRPALIGSVDGGFGQLQDLGSANPQHMMDSVLLQESAEVHRSKGGAGHRAGNASWPGDLFHKLKTGLNRLFSGKPNHTNVSVPQVNQTNPTTGQPLADGERACVLLRRETGRLFDRAFPMESLKSTDRVLLQWAVTGHGWSGSTDKCGEFCHAMYRLRFNNKSTANVTEWRNDCNANPVSDQSGTWEFERNGWCPGSVKPGLYIDVTESVKEGMNEMSVDLVVYSEKSGEYEPYTDWGGFYEGDSATSFMGMTLFVYDAEAADAIKKQAKAYSAAELAVREGCSNPAALKDPSLRLNGPGSVLQTAESSQLTTVKTSLRPNSRSLSQQKQSSLEAVLSANTTETPAKRYDFEQAAPWYTYDQSKQGAPGANNGATQVRALRDALIQISSRQVAMKVKRSEIPEEWGQVGLLLRLAEPPGRTMDFWDRVGSVGLLLKESSQHMQLHPDEGVLTGSTKWKLQQ